jgi:transglutaminase-like putative cysteine protease
MSAVHYAVRHETLYRYRRDVVHAHQQLHLTPRNSERQHCVLHRIDITPQPAVSAEYVDAFGNWVTRVELDRPHNRLQVVAERVRDQLCYNARGREPEWLEAMRFRGESPYVRIKGLLGEYARDCLLPKASVATVCTALMAKIRHDFTYAPGSTEIATPLLQVLANRTGVCQDFSHLMIACLRSVGLSARYVSGYLRTHGPAPATAADKDRDDDDDDADDEDDDQERSAETAAGAGTDREGVVPPLRGADASHAWVAAFAPPFGWIGFDPTNNVIAGQDHVALAWGRDFGDVSPLRGVILGGGSHRLRVRVAVRRIEDPA